MKGMRFLVTALFHAALLVLILIGGCKKEAHEWSPDELKSSNYYYASQRDNREATRIINRAGEVFSVGEKEKVIKLTDDALANARMVQDSFLDKVHPQFKAHFRGEFQAALVLARRNLNSPDSKAAHRAEELFSAFVDWYNANRDDIHMPPAF